MYSKNSVLNKQVESGAWIRQKPKVVRLAVGLLTIAVISNYLPLSVLAAFGQWVNVPSQWIINAAMIAILMTVNSIAYKLGKIVLVGVVALVAFELYTLYITVEVCKWSDWRGYWQGFAFASSALPLNTYLLIRYKKIADL